MSARAAFLLKLKQNASTSKTNNAYSILEDVDLLEAQPKSLAQFVEGKPI